MSEPKYLNLFDKLSKYLVKVPPPSILNEYTILPEYVIFYRGQQAFGVIDGKLQVEDVWGALDYVDMQYINESDIYVYKRLKSW